MRRLILLAALAAMTLPAIAAKRVSVVQLEQALTAAGAAHKPDLETMRLIGEMELTERLTEDALGRLNAKLALGPEAGLALQLLADQSEFLDPPASELPATAAPGDAAQQRMLDAARIYVAKSLPRLPNFLANRMTYRYDDSPRELKKDAWPVRVGLHLVDTSSQETSVREEQENQPGAEGSAVWQAQTGLTTQGEFGSTLGMILADTAKGKISWSHWEETSAGPAAVFQYSVPKSASHFELIGFHQLQPNLQGVATPAVGNRGIAGIRIQPGSVSAINASILRSKPGYHGSLWLDPANGTILRVTIEADPKDSAPFRRAAILVQYGPVQIGDSQFTCPVRSLAFSAAEPDARTIAGDAPTQWLNLTLFTSYRHFAATTRILTDAPAPQ
jgi:hypothetical protein